MEPIPDLGFLKTVNLVGEQARKSFDLFSTAASKNFDYLISRLNEKSNTTSSSNSDDVADAKQNMLVTELVHHEISNKVSRCVNR
jgi:hypothetical protein